MSYWNIPSSKDVGVEERRMCELKNEELRLLVAGSLCSSATGTLPQMSSLIGCLEPLSKLPSMNSRIILKRNLVTQSTMCDFFLGI